MIDNAQEQEHAVIVYFDYKMQNLNPLHSLADQLRKVISDNNVGEYDGHEMAVNYNDGIVFMYGPNAEKLFKVVKPILETVDFMKGATAKLRFGPPEDGVKEIEVQIGLD